MSERKQLPWDPLSKDEISETTRIFKMYHPEGNGKSWVFNSMKPADTPKRILYPLVQSGGDVSSIPRKSELVVIEKPSGHSYHCVINITRKTVEKMAALGDEEQPILTDSDYNSVETNVKKDERIIKLLTDRKLTNMDLVVCEMWPYGYAGSKKYDIDYRGKRVVQVFFYFRNAPNDNYYAHPLDFNVVYDVISQTILRIVCLPIENGRLSSEEEKEEECLPPAPALPLASANYLPPLLPENYYRKDLKPLNQTQPQGPSFTMDGFLVCWQKWKFRICFNYRCGLSFSNITYTDGDKDRLVLYQLGVSEVLTSYADPRPPYNRKYSLDEGEVGLGYAAKSLTEECDCFGMANFLDVYINNEKGEPVLIKNAICIQESDTGILQKHTEYRNNKGYVVRSRRLKVYMACTINNYGYVFTWIFYQDGTLRLHVKLTGLLSPNLMAADADPQGYGTKVFPQIGAQYLQSIFCVRFDPMIDGENNSVVMMDVVPVEGEYGSKTNPYANGFKLKETLFNKTKESVTDTNSKTSRFWVIQNKDKLNPYTKKPVGWRLVPHASENLLAGPKSWTSKRAQFATHDVWVTKYRDYENYAAGEFPNQNPGQNGLRQYVDRNEGISNTDVVFWYVFSYTHIPRVEDFPLTPIAKIEGFVFKPYNFFTTNPGLDVPAPRMCQTNFLKDESEDHRCAECYYGERRTPSSITCEHSGNYNGISN